MKRRDFIAGLAAAAATLDPAARLLASVGQAGWLLVPMDDAQSDHLKAYGLTYRAVQRGVRAEWLLNYRSGAFLIPADPAIPRDAALSGITVEPLDDGQVLRIRAQIQDENMDAIPLEKAPKVAVYVPPNAPPWDDAVTMALN